MKIGIIGAGSMGTTLAHKVGKVGHHAWLASSRGPASLATLARDNGATAATVEDAVDAADVVVLAIPTKGIATRTWAPIASSRAVVIDLGNYHPELRDGRIEAIERGLLDSQWVSQHVGHPVIKAFNNIFARSLQEKGLPKGAVGRIALPVAGDSLEEKALVCRLIDELGFDPIDAGALDDSWRQGTGAPAYCRDLSASALRDALAAATRDRVAQYRRDEEARIRRAMATGTD